MPTIELLAEIAALKKEVAKWKELTDAYANYLDTLPDPLDPNEEQLEAQQRLRTLGEIP